MSETLASLIEQTALRLGDKEAILFLRKGKLENRITYSALREDSNQVAHGLMGMGVGEGDRVILYMPKCVEQIIFHLAVQKIGAISVLLNPGFKKEEMAYFLKDTGAKIVIAGKKEKHLIQSIDPKRPILTLDTEVPYFSGKLFPDASSGPVLCGRNPSDPAILIYTSGTTGQPKGAILTQMNLISDAKNIIAIWEIAEKDILCHTLPLFHVHGLCFALHTSLIAGSKIVMTDEFSPKTTVDVLSQKEGGIVCTLFMGVPTLYAKMMEEMKDQRPDFSHMRLFASGSAPLLPKDFERIKTIFGKEPLEREGMSETGMNFSNPLQGKKKPGCIGLPLPQVEVRIVNPETFEDLEQGEVGEIWLKGPNVTPGYWQKERETKAAFSDGWFRTGDLGKKDEEGYYSITDRLKHIIISGGENISPKEIESVINRYSKVAESCVVGVPDSNWGEKVVAAVVLKPGMEALEKELKDHCKDHLHDWKCPKQVFFLDALPRNQMGKVTKEEVVKRFVSLSPLRKEAL